MDDTDPKRIFEGEALLRRMYKYGLLDESQNKLDYVLALTPQDFLERRLETLVFKLGLAKSIHHARVLIRQRHIRQVANALAAAYCCSKQALHDGLCVFSYTQDVSLAFLSSQANHKASQFPQRPRHGVCNEMGFLAIAEGLRRRNKNCLCKESKR